MPPRRTQRAGGRVVGDKSPKKKEQKKPKKDGKKK